MPNKVNIGKILGIGLVCLFLLGCSKDRFLLSGEETENPASEVVAEEQETDSADIKEDTSDNTANILEEILLGVHVCGAVQKPGVYFLEQGQRICHAIEMAGGLTEEADGDYVNQALLLEDGMKISIPTKEEVEQMKEAKAEAEEIKAQELSGKVNLNTADEALLCTLPGIGASRAQSIISYRTKNGPFESIEDVMKVSGIKEAAFEKIKDLIIVSN